jgi:hypothetical protein
VDPIPDPLLLRKSGTAGNRTWTAGSVARHSDHYTIQITTMVTAIAAATVTEKNASLAFLFIVFYCLKAAVLTVTELDSH